MVRKKEFRLKGFISLEEINLSRQNQNYRSYLFDNSWYFPVKHLIYTVVNKERLTQHLLFQRCYTKMNSHVLLLYVNVGRGWKMTLIRHGGDAIKGQRRNDEFFINCL